MCPIYSAGEKKDSSYNQNQFAKMISKYSNNQVILINNELELKNYLRKNLIKDEIIIGMGAGTISNWLRNLKGKI